ncbi:MAG: LysR family transcriptional regulator [Hyphomicrobiaceae bacterium]|nr:MAG: LysR family transcriptional regulator [Hyphomicrobiaceae bacterium]
MEMHQVRYFLSVARTLNFTRAAEQCNVSQPALTRAIRQLEQEFCGELLRREGKLTHLTDLGARMLPLMQQCYESALAAKSLASSFKQGASQALSLALSHTIEMRLLAGPLAEIQRAFPGMHLTIMRGNAGELCELLQKGSADFAIAGPLGQEWDRLDAWRLFEERFELVTHQDHPFAKDKGVSLSQLSDQQVLICAQCESAKTLAQALDERGVATDNGHRIGSVHDLVALLEANLGIALLPQTAALHPALRRVPVLDLEMSREVSLYGVSGRQRAPVGDAIMKLLRARDWSGCLA